MSHHTVGDIAPLDLPLKAARLSYVLITSRDHAER